jgi:hypothetical protein
MFARAAETKTNADVKVYFARVLAGEIRKPGSFAPATIEVLSRITPDIALLFQNLCGLVARVQGAPMVLVGPFESPGANGLAPVGFNYVTLCRLQDAGLLRHDLGSHITAPPLVLKRFTLAGQVQYDGGAVGELPPRAGHEDSARLEG